MAQQSLNIKLIKKAIPQECYKLSSTKAWFSLLRTFSLVILFQYLLWITPITLSYAPVLIILVFLSGLSFVGIFVLGHDCGHYAFSQKKWVNDLVGTLCHFPIMNGLFAWRAAHDFHHRHTQIRKMDPDWPELLIAPNEKPPLHQKLAVRFGVGSIVGIMLGFWVGMLKRFFFFLAIPQMKLNYKKSFQVFLHSLVSIGLTFLLLHFYFHLIGFEKFILMYALPALVGTSLGALLTFLHHTHKGSYVTDSEFSSPFLNQILGTWNVRFPRWLEWFWLDINIHLPHHISPRIPWYNLKQAHKALKQSYPEIVQDKNFSFGMMMESWRVTKLETVSEGVYRLVER